MRRTLSTLRAIKEFAMRNKFSQLGLIVVGVLIGVAISLNFSAVAQKNTTALPLPIEELRAFTEVFGRVKSDYVEPVEDKKLITEAINGMLTGLDPHSAYLDAEAFKELQVGTQGQFGGLGIEVDRKSTRLDSSHVKISYAVFCLKKKK